MEAELVSLRERVSELENDCIQKSEQLATAAEGKENALVSASAEISSLREESLVKKYMFYHVTKYLFFFLVDTHIHTHVCP